MSLVDYNSFGLIPVTVKGAVAAITGTSPNQTVEIEDNDAGEFIRVETKAGEKFVIVSAWGNGNPNSADNPIPPYFMTNNTGNVTYYATGDKATNCIIEVSNAMIGGDNGYIYFNYLKDELSPHYGLIVYKLNDGNSLLKQIVQNELIMYIKKQLKEMEG